MSYTHEIGSKSVVKKPGFPIRANVGIRPFDRQYTSRYRFLIPKSKIKIFPIGKKIVCAIVLALTSRIFSPKKRFLKNCGLHAMELVTYLLVLVVYFYELIVYMLLERNAFDSIAFFSQCTHVY